MISLHKISHIRYIRILYAPARKKNIFTRSDMGPAPTANDFKSIRLNIK